MKRLLILCAWLAGSALAASCSGGGGGPATSPLDPFGTDPIEVTGDEPTNGGNESQAGNESVAQLCALGCARIAAACGTSDRPDCAFNCAASTRQGCEARFKAFLKCLTTQPLACNDGGVIFPTACQSAATDANTCLQGTP